MSVLQKYLLGSGNTAAVTPQPAAPSAVPTAPHSAPVTTAPALVSSESALPHSQPRHRPYAAQQPAAAALGYSSDSDHSQQNGGPVTAGIPRQDRANVQSTAGDDMGMSPILGQDRGAEVDAKAAADAKALAKLPAQVSRLLVWYAICVGHVVLRASLLEDSASQCMCWVASAHIDDAVCPGAA